MNESLKKVHEFHTMFNQHVGDGPACLEPLEVRQLRIILLFEELQELAEASDCKGTFQNLCEESIGEDPTLDDGDNVDKVEELDALADIQYVLNGKIITAGLARVFDAAFDTVHENNMAKAHTSIDHVKETARVKGLVGHTIYTLFNKFLLYNSDGKLIKPHDHKKVSLKNFVEVVPPSTTSA